MQELRSTEILDKEIQEEAQKKVDKILKDAEDECSGIIASVDEKIKEAEKEKKDFYDKKLENFKKNLSASSPLEKERFKISYIQDQIVHYINQYLNNLGAQKRIQLVLKNLQNLLTADNFKEKKFTAYVYGFDIKKAEMSLTAILGKNLLSCKATEFGKLVLEDNSLEIKEGIILEAEDKSIRLRLTLSEVISQLLDKNREELAKTLFGE